MYCFGKKKKEHISRLAVYNKITTEYKLEPYLIHTKKFEHRRALCRICAHDLQTERGRYLNIAKEDRKCRGGGVKEENFTF